MQQIKPHALGTKWTAEEVETLLRKVEVVKTDAQVACREVIKENGAHAAPRAALCVDSEHGLTAVY